MARRAVAVSLALSLSLMLAGCGTPYVVRRAVLPGDTVATLASQAGVSEGEIRRLNRLGPTENLRAGAMVFVPGAPAPPAAPSSPIPASKAVPPPSSRASESSGVLSRAPALGSALPSGRAERPAGAPNLRWPVDGDVLRGFGSGPTGENRGIDIGVAPGTPVKAAAAGKVTYAGSPAKAYGPIVIVDHGAEFHTVYADLKEVAVRRGDAVAAGQSLGVSGEQAPTAVPHVHFELRHKGEPVDPLLLLPPR